MKNVFKFFALSALLMSFALFAGSVFAQTTTTGSIEGTVTDSTGAAVPGITVTATRQGGRSPLPRLMRKVFSGFPALSRDSTR